MSVTREIPTPYLDGKYGEDINQITSGFKFQAQSNSCYPTCIFNVLKALAVSHNYRAIGFPEHRINLLCRYKQPFGPKMGTVVSNMNNALRTYGYAVREQVSMTYGGLVKVIEDHESSYPIIELSYQYLIDRNPESELGISEPPDHMVITLSCNSSDTILFDPFDTRSRPMQARSDRIGRGLFLIPTSQMTGYWDDAFKSSWAFWVYRRKKETTKTTQLDEYSKTHEVKKQ